MLTTLNEVNSLNWTFDQRFVKRETANKTAENQVPNIITRLTNTKKSCETLPLEYAEQQQKKSSAINTKTAMSKLNTILEN